jgi:hypothetical protein
MKEDNMNHNMRIFVGLGKQNREYSINGVKYIVSSAFQKPNHKEDTTVMNRFKRLTVNEPIPLQEKESSDTMGAEYVCSTVGKEDN